MPIIDNKQKLEEFIAKSWDEVNHYIDQKSEGLQLPFYSSVDIRESKNKFAPVDHNIYPAGFNNLCMLDLVASSEQIDTTVKGINPNCKTIAIFPESHTKNLFYLDHLAVLGKTVRDCGYEVCFASSDSKIFPEQLSPIALVSHSGYDLTIERMDFKNGKVIVSGREIDLVIFNNDQSSKLEKDWDSVQTPIHPTPKIGWFKREKAKHFKHYKNVTDEFCKYFDIDPSLIQAKFRGIQDVDFSAKEGIEQLASEVDLLAKELEPNTPIFVKASQGTYGMGITVVHSGEDILSMNRKGRNKMDIGKNKIKFTSLIIQEGIETALEYEKMPAEIAIYLINGKSVGGFMRANSEKSPSSNLNSKGMIFKKFCISEIRQNQDHKYKEAVYSVIARLATLASSYEIKEIT